MTHDDLSALLDDLIATWENEVIEFKRGKKEFSLSDIGQYFSALSNEANLRDCAFAWLIFGVDDKTRTVVGTDYKEGDSPRIQAVSNQAANQVGDRTHHGELGVTDNESTVTHGERADRCT